MAERSAHIGRQTGATIPGVDPLLVHVGDMDGHHRGLSDLIVAVAVNAATTPKPESELVGLVKGLEAKVEQATAPS